LVSDDGGLLLAVPRIIKRDYIVHDISFMNIWFWRCATEDIGTSVWIPIDMNLQLLQVVIISTIDILANHILHSFSYQSPQSGVWLYKTVHP